MFGKSAFVIALASATLVASALTGCKGSASFNAGSEPAAAPTPTPPPPPPPPPPPAATTPPP
ncbi:MAG TPA: hypothetical protein VNW92_25630, partial [Polyangiaceae bacterium]|nr:hypothetical protein [Polyangiaceae bacterium]